jgi:hypothetical protein
MFFKGIIERRDFILIRAINMNNGFIIINNSDTGISIIIIGVGRVIKNFIMIMIIMNRSPIDNFGAIGIE